MKELTLKELEETAKTVGLGQFPRQCDNGLWEIGPGLYGNEKALALFDKTLKEELNKMKTISDKEYLDRALDFICDLTDGYDTVCEKLHEIPKENKFCAENCEKFDRFCLLRYLKYYNKEKKDGSL